MTEGGEVAAIRALGAALGLEEIPLPGDRLGQPRGYRAAGVVGGRQVFVGAERPSPGHVPVRVMAAHVRDLHVDVYTRPPWPLFLQRSAVKVREQLWFRGRGDFARVWTLLDRAPDLHALAHLDLELDDRGVTARLAAAGEPAALIADVHRVIALAGAIDEAAAAVPVEATIAWAAPRFAAAAAALGLTFTTCALGVRGTRDGCRISTQSLDLEPRAVLLHIELCRILPGRWALRARGRRWWQRLDGAVHALVGRGSGRFAFDRRFTFGGDRDDAVRAVADHLDALIDFADHHRLSVHGDRVVVGFRLRKRTMPDVAALLERAIAVAHLVGGAPDPTAPAGPFR